MDKMYLLYYMADDTDIMEINSGMHIVGLYTTKEQAEKEKESILEKYAFAEEDDIFKKYMPKDVYCGWPGVSKVTNGYKWNPNDLVNEYKGYTLSQRKEVERILDLNETLFEPNILEVDINGDSSEGLFKYLYM